MLFLKLSTQEYVSPGMHTLHTKELERQRMLLWHGKCPIGHVCSLASYLSSCIFFGFGQFNKIGASTYAVMEDEVSEAHC
jgi:hypothetical protein